MQPNRSILRKAWSRLGSTAAGRWMVSKMVAHKAPYFSTIRARLTVMETGRVEATMPFRRSITNHIGSVHAIAMCNLAELVGGACADVSVPGDMRWIPVGMQVAYRKIARTDLHAVATLGDSDLSTAGDVVSHVDVMDTHGDVVFTADISIRVSKRKDKAA